MSGMIFIDVLRFCVFGDVIIKNNPFQLYLLVKVGNNNWRKNKTKTINRI